MNLLDGNYSVESALPSVFHVSQSADATFGAVGVDEAVEVLPAENKHFSPKRQLIVDEFGDIVIRDIVQVDEAAVVSDGAQSSLSEEFKHPDIEEMFLDHEGRILTEQDIIEYVETDEESDSKMESLSPSDDKADERIDDTMLEYPHRCYNCGNCFMSSGHLKTHMRTCLKNCNEKTCNICGKKFASAFYFEEHMLLHADQGPRRCERCRHRCSDAKDWLAHMEVHDREDKLNSKAASLAQKKTGAKIVVKIFTCAFCMRNFCVVFKQGEVRRRLVCDQCSIKYTNPGELKKHKDRMQDERKVLCDRCGHICELESLFRHQPVCGQSDTH